jgi:hypothetical protein
MGGIKRDRLGCKRAQEIKDAQSAIGLIVEVSTPLYRHKENKW